jgi:ABC-type multidrug transport system permease subunit
MRTLKAVLAISVLDVIIMAMGISAGKILGLPDTAFTFGLILFMTLVKLGYMLLINSAALLISGFVFKPKSDFARTILLGMTFYLLGIIAYMSFSDGGIISHYHRTEELLFPFSPAIAAVILPTLLAYITVYYLTKTKRTQWIN